MKTDKPDQESARLQLNQFFELAKSSGKVRTQKEFAQLIGIHPTVCSQLLKGDIPVTTQMQRRIENEMAVNGFAVGENATAIVTHGQQGDNLGGHAQKNFGKDSEPSKWFALVDEKDKQIDRLLSLLENEQASKQELEKKNGELIDALIKKL